ncbi:hypothetical protein CJF30_00006183 [Rutstroemia sp. NJR-2017a BBW]|nr:hypothetical protein CJF30_00006183 [Rutstroemia sp. NJR-2017a BBW]
MSATPRFFSQPVRYLRWAAVEKPAIFFSIVIGSAGPVVLLAAPPIRRAIRTVPTTPRKPLSGYDDE